MELLQVVYSFATQRFSRETLFNLVVGAFMAWFVVFAALYPRHEAVHFHGLAAVALERLPSGFAGAVGMVRCWHCAYSGARPPAWCGGSSDLLRAIHSG